MCDSRKNDKKNKGDEDMNAVLKRQNKFNTTRGRLYNNSYKNIKLSSNVADNLAKGRAVLKCKNGVVQIDKDHPNYDFWMED